MLLGKLVHRVVNRNMSELWFMTLSVADRESLFTTMRELGAQADSYFLRAQQLAPPAGAIAVGGGYFDEVLKAEIISSYLRALRQGETPQRALDITEKDRTKYVRAWNRSRGGDYVIHRADTAEQTFIEDIHRRVLGSVERVMGGALKE